MNNISAYLKIARPVNFVITFVSTVVAGLICSSVKEITLPMVSAGFSAGLTAAAGNVINDFYDVKIDKINRPERPLPSGAISKLGALLFYLALLIASLLIASFVNSSAFIIVAITSVFIFLYSYKIKFIPAFGNFVVAFFTGFVFIYGGMAVENWEGGIFPAVFAFLINLMREMTKDIEDMEGDAAAGVNSFPIYYGVGKTKSFIVTLSGILIFTTFLPYFLGVYNVWFLAIIAVLVDLPLFYFNKVLLRAEKKQEYRKASLMLKLLMIIGLAAIFAGTL